MKKRKSTPPGHVAEQIVRGMIRTLGRKLKNTSLTPRETLALLREQRKLAKQLEASTRARIENDREDEMNRNIAAMEAARSGNEPATQPKDEMHDGA
ncbi:MAG: hypothetical protein DMG96_41325 [Acidobacteria bacterium]|nr:MAG: hypothetical protein DMG98_16370 [Acidobacteriota bacterium]PYV66785.1 MAG: hypothetical protein DMG96_41325 [Acidobacteriota bacterium]